MLLLYIIELLFLLFQVSIFMFLYVGAHIFQIFLKHHLTVQCAADLTRV